MSDDEDVRDGPVAVFSFTYNCVGGIANSVSTSDVQNLPPPTASDDGVFTASAPGFGQILEDIGATHYIYQLERGSETGRLHLQGYIRISPKARPGTLHNRLPDEHRRCIFRRASTAGCSALRRYCLKDQTRVLGPWCDPTHTEELRKQRDVDELKYDPSEEDAQMVAHPYHWQQTVIDYLDGAVHPRSILWIVDETGSSGKSSFVKSQTEPERRLSCMLSYTRASDMLALVLKWGPKKTYLIDLPRAKPMEQGLQDLYSGLEMIKNGYVISGKYEGGGMKWKRPHVVVFANHLPHFEFMSQDRWDVRRVNHEDHSLSVV